MKKHKPNLILFDLDGTLAQSLEVGLDTMNLIRFFFGYQKLSHDDPSLRQKSGIEFVRDVLKLSIPQFAIWMQMMKGLMSMQAGQIPVYAGWREIIKNHLAKNTLGIVTSSSKRYTQTILKNADLNDFKILETGVGYLRKDRVLKKILTTQKTAPSHALYVGDELRDLVAAHKAGIPFLAVSWGKDEAGVFEKSTLKPRGVLNTPEDLLDYV